MKVKVREDFVAAPDSIISHTYHTGEVFEGGSELMPDILVKAGLVDGRLQEVILVSKTETKEVPPPEKKGPDAR